MMICPEHFYEMNLRGRSAEEIMRVIRGLKREIGRLKNTVEHPAYECTMHPSERVRISCARDYLERAKRALKEVGGTYVPSAAERKAEELDECIPFVHQVTFRFGGFFTGYETKTYTVDGEKVRMRVEHSLVLKPSNLDESDIEPIDKEQFLGAIRELRIGEWRRRYDTRRFGLEACDGTQWSLELSFSNGHKPVKIYGDNAYPYNFERVLEIFDVIE